MPLAPFPETGTTLTLTEHGEFQPLPGWLDIDEFRLYLKRVWEARHTFYEDPASGEYTEGAEYGEKGTFRSLLGFDGRLVRARNYAGFIRFGKLTIRIVPKLFAPENYTWAEAMHHLHYYLSWGRPAVHPAGWADSPLPRSGDYLQWQIGVFARFARTVLTAAPYQTYVDLTDADSFSRGQLAVGDYLRQQISTGNWQRLNNHFSRYQLDNTYNRMVRRVASLLLPIAGPESRGLLGEVLESLPGVADIPCTVQECDQLMGSLHRGPQRRLLALCRWFLAGTAGNDEAMNDDNFFYLVPAGRLFENFLTGFIRYHFPGWEAESQSVAYLGQSRGKVAAPVRNDLWLPEKKLVVEIKYKKIIPDPAGVPAADIYQLLAYAVARQTSNVHLVYPATRTEEVQGFRIEIPLQANRMPVTIHVHFVPVLLPPLAEGEDVTAGSFALLTQRLQEKLHQAINQ